ncbi:PadR family transcriptional regulator [Candidatus Woesearchaeota archaeon]|nr:PadR family transcriptional regulator [Candidatus Woesearchaeota archaeon]
MVILKALSKREMSGYSIMMHVEEKTGKKPSTGSVYPILEDMLKIQFVSVKRDGRRKLYKLTLLGKKHLEEFMKQKDDMMKNLVNHIRMCACLCSKNGKTRGVLEEMEGKLNSIK